MAQVPNGVMVTRAGMLWRALDGGRESKIDMESLSIRRRLEGERDILDGPE